MTTTMLWLLISIPVDWDRNRKPTVLVERFATVEECQRVRAVILGDRIIADGSTLRCIQATVAKP